MYSILFPSIIWKEKKRKYRENTFGETRSKINFANFFINVQTIIREFPREIKKINQIK